MGPGLDCGDRSRHHLVLPVLPHPRYARERLDIMKRHAFEKQEVFGRNGGLTVSCSLIGRLRGKSFLCVSC